MQKWKIRETWLSDAKDRFAKHFKTNGYTIPERVRVSCGLPSSGAFRTRRRAIGEAWASTQSDDEHFEIFISPTICDPTQVMATLAHELVHVTVGLKAGHRGHFIECARAIGLAAPWVATHADAKLAEAIAAMLPKIGDYPHASLNGMTNEKKKQTARLLKVGCPHCGYTTRITMQWILVAVPTCPNEDCEHHGETFEVVLPGE